MFSRRDLLRATGLGLWGISSSGWLPAFADEVARHPARRRQCVLLWMPGGPSQIDTFDMKPRHANGGAYKEIATSVPGLGLSEHLPKLAGQAEHLAIVRSLSTKEGDHGRGTYLMRTGHQQGGPIKYPAIGASLAKELGSEEAEVPNYVSIAPYSFFSPASFSSGFLGPRYAPLTVGVREEEAGGQSPAAQSRGYAQLGVDDLSPHAGVTPKQATSRLDIWKSLEDGFVSRHRTASAIAHQTVYQRAVRMMKSEAAQAFDLSNEDDKTRERYGRGRFGQSCLMARRLIERGVPFVEVSLGGLGNGGIGWDTHQDNFRLVQQLSAELDAGWGTLLAELAERGLLDTTTILWMGEFGRTPRINNTAGRDHFPAAWSCVFAGGGIHGGQAYGRTSADGMTVEDGKVDVGDVLATLCAALGINPAAENISEEGRPIKIAEGKAIEAILRG
ncbi:MAG TPA: DUF1501 domain-containing protein [Pirellulales bacterium]|nr:DUF1501 domain-containing protein [Pirellulales bacterium]